MLFSTLGNSPGHRGQRDVGNTPHIPGTRGQEREPITMGSPLAAKAQQAVCT